MKKQILSEGIAATTLVACQWKPVTELTSSGIDPAKFRTQANNAKTSLHMPTRKAGMEVGITYNQRACGCLEIPYYPNRPTKRQWPSVAPEPGQTYNSKRIFKFSV